MSTQTLDKGINHRQSIDDGSEENTITGEEVGDQKKRIHPTEEEEKLDLPVVPEIAPFPVMGSLEEITQTLSRVKSNQTQKFSDDEKNNAVDTIEDTADNVTKEGGATAFKQTPYHTEGIRNPGWLSVISCFLVNFFIFGTTFSWGDYQNL